jgi:ribosomal protein S12 methylthiotransferase
MDFVRDTQFDHVGVFTYSHEEGTRAHGLDDDVPAKLKKARRDAVMRLQKQIVTARLKTRRGDHVRVMVDGVSPDSDLVMTGRLEGQAPEIDAQVYFDQCDPATLIPGTLVHATISGVRGYDLVVTPK